MKKLINAVDDILGGEPLTARRRATPVSSYLETNESLSADAR